MDDTNKKSNQDSGEQKAEKPVEDTALETCQKERDDFKNKYLRALADYQNFERRVRDEKAEIRKNAQADILRGLLSFLDDLEKAIVFVNDPGLQIIKKNFQEILKEYGLTELQLVGNEYDPYFAEAVDIVEGDKDNIIVEVVRKGYRFNDRILRPAQVKVSRKK